jgi:hypothetical protein
MKFIKRKKVFILSLITVLIIGTFSIAYASFSSQKTIINTFHAGTVNQCLTECFTSPHNWNPGDCTAKIIHVTNTGSKAVYVRLKIIPKWNCNLSTSNVSYIPNNPNWFKIGDYYYYKKILGSPMEKINNSRNVTLPLNVCFNLNSGNEYQDKTFTLTITSDVIQAKNNAIYSAWNLTPSQVAQIGFEHY